MNYHCLHNKKKEVIFDFSNVKSSRFLGYCPKCRFLINKKDLETKFIFVCPGCGKRARIKFLQKKINRENLTKKEYLENTINADHHDMPALNEHDPGDLKVIL
jgi:ssDNA-binding Zn-finger/Zn-ribbon topoisomerase 1